MADLVDLNDAARTRLPSSARCAAPEFVAHNAPSDLAMLQLALARTGIDYVPVGVACTLDAFRLLEPQAEDHRLESICARRGIVLEDVHDALNDVIATAALVRVILDAGFAPETVQLDHAASLRLRSGGDIRPASDRQIRMVFGLARANESPEKDGGQVEAHEVEYAHKRRRVRRIFGRR